jgi:hypothetical protein
MGDYDGAARCFHLPELLRSRSAPGVTPWGRLYIRCWSSRSTWAESAIAYTGVTMRRSTPFLVLLLVVCLVVFVDLVDVPQVRQLQPFSTNDLIGTWRFDDATELKRIRAISPQLSEQGKAWVMAGYAAGKVLQITADKMLSWDGRMRYETSYTITTESDNKFTADLIDNEGNYGGPSRDVISWANLQATALARGPQRAVGAGPARGAAAAPAGPTARRLERRLPPMGTTFHPSYCTSGALTGTFSSFAGRRRKMASRSFKRSTSP